MCTRLKSLLATGAVLFAVIGLMGDVFQGLQPRPFVWPLALLFLFTLVLLNRVCPGSSEENGDHPAS